MPPDRSPLVAKEVLSIVAQNEDMPGYDKVADLAVLVPLANAANPL